MRLAGGDAHHRVAGRPVILQRQQGLVPGQHAIAEDAPGPRERVGATFDSHHRVQVALAHGTQAPGPLGFAHGRAHCARLRSARNCGQNARLARASPRSASSGHCAISAWVPGSEGSRPEARNRARPRRSGSGAGRRMAPGRPAVASSAATDAAAGAAGASGTGPRPVAPSAGAGTTAAAAAADAGEAPPNPFAAAGSGTPTSGTGRSGTDTAPGPGPASASPLRRTTCPSACNQRRCCGLHAAGPAAFTPLPPAASAATAPAPGRTGRRSRPPPAAPAAGRSPARPAPPAPAAAPRTVPGRRGRRRGRRP